MRVIFVSSDIKKGLEKMRGSIGTFSQDVLNSVAEGIEVDLKNRITNEVQPDGAPQQKNTSSTMERKQRLGRGNTPLVDTGRMIRAQWRQGATPHQVLIALPADRQGKILNGLTARGYVFFAVPVTVDGRQMSDFVREAMRNSFARLLRGSI